MCLGRGAKAGRSAHEEVPEKTLAHAAARPSLLTPSEKRPQGPQGTRLESLLALGIEVHVTRPPHRPWTSLEDSKRQEIPWKKEQAAMSV